MLTSPRVELEKKMPSPTIAGILSPEDTALIKPLRDYAQDIAILNTGGKTNLLNLRQPDLSKAIMTEQPRHSL